jgi:hypothetical protein
MARSGMAMAWRAGGRRLAERMAVHRAGRIGLHVGALLFDREVRWHSAGIARELAMLWLKLRARGRLARRRVASA